MSKISQGNKFRKVVQIEFKTEKEYAVLHQRAVKLFGDNHRADSSYIRECCRKQRTEKKQTFREKARSLVESTQRLNELVQAYFEHEMIRGAELSGVKKIRIHDLRHSHASLLISELGMQPNLVADRLGHEKIQTTLSTYSHLYPDQSRKLADELNKLMDEKDEE